MVLEVLLESGAEIAKRYEKAKTGLIYNFSWLVENTVYEKDINSLIK
jgi:hypothetical protein